MTKKTIPFPKPPPASLKPCQEQEHVHLKASGEHTRIRLADLLKEEAERVRTVALLLEVAETICRDETASSPSGKKGQEKG